MGVLSFPQLAGASIGESELEWWEVSYPDSGETEMQSYNEIGWAV